VCELIIYGNADTFSSRNFLRNLTECDNFGNLRLLKCKRKNLAHGYTCVELNLIFVNSTSNLINLTPQMASSYNMCPKYEIYERPIFVIAMEHINIQDTPLAHVITNCSALNFSSFLNDIHVLNSIP
jgi:hypothetical protein